MMTEERIHASGCTDLTDSVPCCSGTNPEDAIMLKQEGSMNNSTNFGTNDEMQNEKIENSLIEPSWRTISNLVVIAPQNDDFGKCELFQTNRIPYSPDHQEDVNQDPTIPSMEQEMMDVIIKKEINEDVSMAEIDDKQVQGEIKNCEEHIKLEDDMNNPWVDKLKVTVKTEAQPDMMNEMSVTSSDEGSDYDESCPLSSGGELNEKEKRINVFESVHHMHSYAQSHECSQCNKHVKSAESRENHMLTHSQSNVKCLDCNKEFQQPIYLKHHPDIKPITHQIVKLFSCPDCNRMFNKESSLKIHLKQHSSERSYQCTTCDKSFMTQHNLQIHQRTHTVESPFACETCNKSFTDTALFHNHMITHQNVKLLSCPDCNKVFPNESSFKRHLRIHSGDRPHRCTMCDKTFKNSYNLKVHQRLHTGEKPYACTTCDKSFRHQSSLNVHQSTHIYEKPYACTTCDKSFSNQSSLNVHQRIHTGQKQCSVW